MEKTTKNVAEVLEAMKSGKKVEVIIRVPVGPSSTIQALLNSKEFIITSTEEAEKDEEVAEENTDGGEGNPENGNLEPEQEAKMEEIAEKLAEMMPKDKTPKETQEERIREVKEAYLGGKSMKEIAEKYGMPYSTVHYHCKGLKRE